jgi:hypothetical protein
MLEGWRTGWLVMSVQTMTGLNRLVTLAREDAEALAVLLCASSSFDAPRSIALGTGSPPAQAFSNPSRRFKRSST